MEKPKLSPEILEVLTTGHFAYLCTTNKRNQPHVTPMFYVFDEKSGNVYVVASSDSKKMQNIHENPKISIAVDVRDSMNPFNNRGVMVQGRAMVHYAIDSLSELDDKSLMQIYADFQEKYPLLRRVKSPVTGEYQNFSENLITLEPTRMIYWKGVKFITVNLEKNNSSQKADS